MLVPEQLGPFHLTRLLGKGGMGMVYEARQSDSSELVALKVLLSLSGDGTDRHDRFEGEIEALKRLHHPNIVRLIGFGEAEEISYFAMEYVDGSSLETLLRRDHRRFTWEEAVHIGVNTARALRHAHNRGIIHRDIKPANILLSKNGEVKVSDYGIAQLFGGRRKTADDTVIGTLEYMAPEQASSRPITVKTDLFSLGAVLYTLLTGTPPFPLKKKSLPELLEKFAEGPAESARLHRHEVPREFDDLLMELLEIDPEKRPPSAQIVLNRLEKILEEHSVSGGLSRFFESDGVGGEGETDPSRAETAPIQRSGSPSRVDLAASETTDGGSDTDKTVTTGVLNKKAPQQSGSHSLEWTESSTSQETLVDPAAPRSVFTLAPEEEFDPYSEPKDTPYLSLRILLFSCVLLLVGTVLALSLRRPSADRLFGRIESRLSGISSENESDYFGALRQARADLSKFLALYPNDPRADRIRRLNGDLEYAALETRLSRLAERSIFRAAPPGSLIESAYIEALRAAERDPEEGVRKFRAFLDIFDRDESLSSPYSVPAQCVRLARRRLERLEKEIKHREDEERDLVAEQLGYARTLEESDPAHAARIREGLREFYGNRPWAGELLGE